MKLKTSKKISKGSNKVFINLQKYTDREGKEKFFCGYKEGKKYKEQAEHFGSADEAKLALNN